MFVLVTPGIGKMDKQCGGDIGFTTLFVIEATMNHIQYHICVANSHSHLFSVKITFPSNINSTYTLSLPAWLPGSYMIRDFAKHIVDLSVSNDATITPIDKQTWLLATEGNACTLDYQVYAFDSSVRTAYLDNQRAFFNGSSLFLCIDELQTQPHRVNLIQPQFSHRQSRQHPVRENKRAIDSSYS